MVEKLLPDGAAYPGFLNGFSLAAVGRLPRYWWGALDQLENLADDRLLAGCVYCGGGGQETRDHVPSRILLEQPFADNLPVVAACLPCNNSFSLDEEYVACLIECAVAGSTDPTRIRRPRVAKILQRNPALRARLEEAKQVVDGAVAFVAEAARLENVLLKLARGHAAFELAASTWETPSSLMWWPMSMMTDEQRDNFDAPLCQQMLGEVGSRGMQRLLVTQVLLQSESGDERSIGLLLNDWVVVQEGRYRYLASDDVEGVVVRIVIGEFLACEVAWAHDADLVPEAQTP